MYIVLGSCRGFENRDGALFAVFQDGLSAGAYRLAAIVGRNSRDRKNILDIDCRSSSREPSAESRGSFGKEQIWASKVAPLRKINRGTNGA